MRDYDEKEIEKMPVLSFILFLTLSILSFEILTGMLSIFLAEF